MILALAEYIDAYKQDGQQNQLVRCNQYATLIHVYRFAFEHSEHSQGPRDDANRNNFINQLPNGAGPKVVGLLNSMSGQCNESIWATSVDADAFGRDNSA